MKRFLAGLCLLAALCGVAMLFRPPSKPAGVGVDINHWNSDRNFPRVRIHSGAHMFLDKSSVKLQSCEQADGEETLVLRATVFRVPWNDFGKRTFIATRYAYRKAGNECVMHSIDDNGKRRALPRSNLCEADLDGVAVGEAIYFVHCGERFYNLMGEEFYARLK